MADQKQDGAVPQDPDTSNTISGRLLDLIPANGVVVRDAVKQLITTVRNNPDEISRGVSDLLGLNKINPAFAADNIAQVQLATFFKKVNINPVTTENALNDGVLTDPEALRLLADLGNNNFAYINPSAEALEISTRIAGSVGVDDEDVTIGIALLETGLAPLAPYINDPGHFPKVLQALGLIDKVIKESPPAVLPEDYFKIGAPPETDQEFPILGTVPPKPPGF